MHMRNNLKGDVHVWRTKVRQTSKQGAVTFATVIRTTGHPQNSMVGMVTKLSIETDSKL